MKINKEFEDKKIYSFSKIDNLSRKINDDFNPFINNFRFCLEELKIIENEFKALIECIDINKNKSL